MDRFNEMLVFQTVAERGGFAAAARQLGTSGPSVTRAVAALESRLGARLFHRTTRRVQLTDAGERFLQECRRLLADLAEAEAVAAGTHATPRGLVGVTSSQLFGRAHVGPLLCALLRRQPLISVRTLFVDRVVNLYEEHMDIAVRLGPLTESSLRAVPVGRVRRVVCASPAYLDAHGVPASPDDLADHACIQFTGQSPGPEWNFRQGRSVRVQSRLITDSADLAVASAIAGDGCARLLSYQVEPALRSGRLVVLLAGFEPAPLPVHVLHHEGMRVSAKVRAVFDHLVDGLRADQALA
ncbi:LysR family transcriptional regulator [Marilutibacter chinensis]|uniref:LysR family transcriptional regulator n=1 Tax=Marilutibacter chinensis TaxID=2912247 RepID=A0ABS9HZD9_9GAMM|nr:LysR family transcriptional regulator [Lysobacter chinensis]MCF7223547.1 LysR family transcriptional regulator [Lysobacter chinensis]